MTFQRYLDEIVAVWTDGCDLIVLTRAGREFRMLAENIRLTKAHVLNLMHQRVKLIASGNYLELILDAA